MSKPINVTIPLACPHCLTELLTTYEDVQQEATIHCAECGTLVELTPEKLPLPQLFVQPADEMFSGIEFQGDVTP
jgi:uncharacterized Zn finger protein